jgi:hypothetical protein
MSSQTWILCLDFDYLWREFPRRLASFHLSRRRDASSHSCPDTMDKSILFVLQVVLSSSSTPYGTASEIHQYVMIVYSGMTYP